MTKLERFHMEMINEFKQICRIVEKQGYIIFHKSQMLKLLNNEHKKDARKVVKIKIEDFTPIDDLITALMKSGMWVSIETKDGWAKYICFESNSRCVIEEIADE